MTKDGCQSCDGSGLDENPLNDRGPCPECNYPNSAKAIIEDGFIVIRVPLANLQAIMDGGFACNAYSRRYKVTDTAGFGKEITDELDREDEEGTTPIHRLFDAAINSALDSGAQHAEEHPEQEI